MYRTEVKTTNTDVRFATVNTRITLEDMPDTAESTRAIPDLQAWAPFATTKIWNQTDEPVSTKNAGGAKVGGGAMGLTAEAHIEHERNRERTERFFDKGESKIRHSTKDGRRNGVMWTLTQNKATNECIAHKFCLAMLFSREQDTPVEMTLGLRCNAGLLGKVENWFGQGPNFDEKQKYTPQPNKPRVRYEEGRKLRKLVDPENLGELYKEDGKGGVNLLKLTSVESSRGLIPLNL